MTAHPPEETVFRPEFLALGAADVAADIGRQGFFVAEGAVRRAWMEQIEAELRDRPLVMNTNDVGPVRWQHQTYFAHAMAASRPYFELVTHKRIRDVARAYLGERFRLKCQRYYQSGPGHELPWHTDNKTSMLERTDIRGIGVVLYFSDTYEGELQVVPRSHEWTAQIGRTEFTDEQLPPERVSEIRTISARAGTLIFFDSQTLHRTRKITIEGYVRRSVFLQIDSDLAHSERTLLDPSLLDPDDRDLLRFLGVGMPAGYPVMPPSSIASLSDRDLLRLVRTAVGELSRRRSNGRIPRLARRIRDTFRRA